MSIESKYTVAPNSSPGMNADQKGRFYLRPGSLSGGFRTEDQCAGPGWPLVCWQLPEVFPTLRRLLEARMGHIGKREYVQVLRLVETFSPQQTEAAVKQALQLGAIGFDAVKHLLLCSIERKPPRLNLDIYPYLPRIQVKTTATNSYLSLLNKVAV